MKINFFLEFALNNSWALQLFYLHLFSQGLPRLQIFLRNNPKISSRFIFLLLLVRFLQLSFQDIHWKFVQNFFQENPERFIPQFVKNCLRSSTRIPLEVPLPILHAILSSLIMWIFEGIHPRFIFANLTRVYSRK